MLEFKTKGNLNQEEAALLTQSLMSLRIAYVESVDYPPPSAESRTEQGGTPAGAGSTSETDKPPAASASTSGEDDHRKKFTKKY